MLEKIKKLLIATPGLRGKQIANKLKEDKHEVNSFLSRNKRYFQQDSNYRWTIKSDETSIIFDKGWVDCDSFEKALSRVQSPLESDCNLIVFVISKDCYLLLEAIARLMAICNQLASMSKKVVLDFTLQPDTLGYVDRLGFFEHLINDVTVLPQRPETSAAQVYKDNNDYMVELGVINPKKLDDSIPERFKKVFVNLAGKEYENTAFTIIAELYGNVRDHSNSPIPGFIGLQCYKKVRHPHIQTVISDSGIGILGTLMPILKSKYPLIAKELALSKLDSNIHLLKKIFIYGDISQVYTKGRGLGLKRSTEAASKFNASIMVRQDKCQVKFIYKYGELKDFFYQIDMPLIKGTHICFDFQLDKPDNSR